MITPNYGDPHYDAVPRGRTFAHHMAAHYAEMLARSAIGLERLSAGEMAIARRKRDDWNDAAIWNDVLIDHCHLTLARAA